MQADLPAVRQVLVGYPFPMADTGDVCNFPVYRDEAELPEPYCKSEGNGKVRFCLPSLLLYRSTLQQN